VIRKAGTFAVVVVAALFFAATAAAQKPNGQLAGVVVDFSGKPQMGATVWVAADGPAAVAAIRARTNQAGRFLLEKLPIGAYTIRVTLTGFLPAMTRNVVVSANATTVLKLQLDSVFSSLAQMRQAPKSGTQPDDWDWVLRTSASTRPVLRWRGDDDSGGPGTEGSAKRRTPRARVALTSGDTEPGIASSLTQSAFAYDQPIGVYGRLFLAGQFSYDAPGTAGLATTWVPFGESADSPRTTFALRQYRLGDQGPMLRALRSEQAGGVHLTQRVTLHYTAEYVWLSFRNAASAMNPRADLTVAVARGWTATLFAGTVPARNQFGPTNLESALDELAVFPSVMFRNGNPVIGHTWHEEVRIERKILKNGQVSVAGFHDQGAHTPVYATAADGGVQPIDALPITHAVDGGGVSAYGARFAYRQKLAANLEAALVYAWAGALVGDNDVDGAGFRSFLQERPRHSVALSLDSRVSRTKTRVTFGYKWVNGQVASRQDAYGEALYNTDPFLNLSVHQALPQLLGGGKLEAVADLLNILGEGTFYRTTPDGRLSLTPSPRVLRGGLSFQF